MHSLYLTMLFVMLTVFAGDQASQAPASAPSNVQSFAAPPPSNLIFQSSDGGETWQDISEGLPIAEQAEAFFAGQSDLYLRTKGAIYRSKSNLKAPVWEQVSGIDPRCNSIAFNRSGIIAFNYEGEIFRKTPSAETWIPAYPTLQKASMRTIFETADGKLLFGCDDGLYRSSDKGKTWTQVQNEGWVITLVESEGVLLATGQKGIMRSTDNGEHWEWVIRQGGVGIAIEQIDGGYAAIVYNTSTMSRRILISMDQGKGTSWTAIDKGLPPSMSISSIKQVGKYLLCGHPDGIFRSADLGKTWEPVLSNPNTHGAFKTPGVTWNNGKVFTLHVSGNVVYAVMKDAGC